MAINKYIINTSDRWSSLFDILQENATDFFDSIEIDGTDQITCKVGEDTALLIYTGNITSNGLYTLYTKNGNTQFVTGSEPVYVIVTSKGILIHSNVSNNIPTDLFICKTNNGDLAVACLGVYYSGGTYYRRFWVIDWKNTTNINYYWSYSDNSNNLWPAISPIRGDNIKETTFTPIPCSQAESHLDGVYQLTYNQYYNIYGEITDGEGNSYFSNGCLALAD